MYIYIIVISVIVFIGCFVFVELTITPKRKLKRALSGEYLLLDVRSEGEFSAGHIPNAESFPIEKIDSDIREHIPEKNVRILCYSMSGTRSARAVKKLKKIGYKNAHNLGSFIRAEIVLKEKK